MPKMLPGVVAVAAASEGAAVEATTAPHRNHRPIASCRCQCGCTPHSARPCDSTSFFWGSGSTHIRSTPQNREHSVQTLLRRMVAPAEMPPGGVEVAVDVVVVAALATSAARRSPRATSIHKCQSVGTRRRTGPSDSMSTVSGSGSNVSPSNSHGRHRKTRRLLPSSVA